MSYIVDISATTVHGSVREARRVAQAVGLILGDDRGIKIYAPYSTEHISVEEPTYDKSLVTRGRQEAESIAMTIANKVSTVLGLTPDLFNRAVVLDETTREWSVDYKNMVATVKTSFPGDASKLELFQGIVKDVLAANALRGISFK